MPGQTRRLRQASRGGNSRELPDAIGTDHTEIAQLAYQFWLDRGCPIGSPEEDWSRAEQDLKSKQIQTE